MPPADSHTAQGIYIMFGALLINFGAPHANSSPQLEYR
jgi:hypothetical protein